MLITEYACNLLFLCLILFSSHEDETGWMEIEAECNQQNDRWTAEISNLTPQRSYDFRVVAKYAGEIITRSGPLPNIMTCEYTCSNTYIYTPKCKNVSVL